VRHIKKLALSGLSRCCFGRIGGGDGLEDGLEALDEGGLAFGVVHQWDSFSLIRSLIRRGS